MHNGGPFEVRGNIARSLAERHDRVAALLIVPDSERGLRLLAFLFRPYY
jgi:hypothetical protein